MVKKIRLCKGREIGNKSFAIGINNKKWEPEWARIEFPEIRIFTEVKDGSIDGFPIRYKETGEKVPATEIVKLAFEQNGMTVAQNSKGYTKRNHYGELHKWFIDYDKELDSFFQDNDIPLPSDKRSYDERMTDTALGNLKAQGVNVAAGQQALEEAKAKNEELAKAKEELAALKAEKAQLEKALTKKPKAEKEAAVV